MEGPWASQTLPIPEDGAGSAYGKQRGNTISAEKSLDPPSPSPPRTLNTSSDKQRGKLRHPRDAVWANKDRDPQGNEIPVPDYWAYAMTPVRSLYKRASTGKVSAPCMETIIIIKLLDVWNNIIYKALSISLAYLRMCFLLRWFRYARIIHTISKLTKFTKKFSLKSIHSKDIIMAVLS